MSDNKQKYIFLFNHDNEETELLEALPKMFPDIKILQGGYTQLDGNPVAHSNELSSWITQEQFLATWIFVECFPDYEFIDKIEILHGIEYLENHLTKEEYIRYI